MDILFIAIVSLSQQEQPYHRTEISPLLYRFLEA